MRIRSLFVLAFVAVVSFSLACKQAITPAPVPAKASADDSGPPRQDAHIERFIVTVDDAPTLGPADAPVTIVMFSDFECPFCTRGLETLRRLREMYPKDIRVAYKAYPMDNHSHALLAAMAARSAQAQGKFWEFHDLLLSGRALDPGVILQYARQANLNMDALVRDLDALEYGTEVRRDARQGRRLGVTGTPTFFVNGRVISGAMPLAQFDEMVNEELRYAENLRAAGIPDAKLYQEITSDGYEGVRFQNRRGLDPDSVNEVPLSDSPQRGPKTAPITIVAFSDFQCPFCARGDATLQRVAEVYGDKLRFVHKNLPLSFHKHAMPAAQAALAAHAQGKFWEFHDALYERAADFERDDLREIAKQVDLDLQRFDAAMEDPNLRARVEADMSLAMSIGVASTPAYLINGRPIEGAVPELEFLLLIEEELERAAAALDSGVVPSGLYEHLTSTPLAD